MTDVTADREASGGLPRILTIMGSGETAPTMVKVHRLVLERLGPPPVTALLLDTPFGFQENATELAQRIVNYFAESLRAPIDVASTGEAGLDGAAGPIDTSNDPFAIERLVGKVRQARYIFAGPGSPSYALRKWSTTVVPSLLAETLELGGAVTFSSAAALTLGVATVPVYEVYKVGEDPFWLEGLNILAMTGLSAAVIPHYNNAEGGTHDTRYCYLGERRLSKLETELPKGAFVLGVDEHTALVMDLDEQVGTVAGNGVVTVRAAGRSRTWVTGETIAFDELAGAAKSLAKGGGGARTTRAKQKAASEQQADADDADPGHPGRFTESLAGESDLFLSGTGGRYEGSPLITAVREKESDFSRALQDRDIAAAVQAVLDLEADLTAWAHDIPAGDALDRGHAALRSVIVDLGRAAESGVRDPRDVLGPFVEALLELRQKARSERRFEDADAIRDRLGDLGIDVRDTTSGSDWLLGSDHPLPSRPGSRHC
ncbi:MAG: CysS/YqeB C-terminal domain-containing protein [Acidimicrobiales bacterium]